MLGFSPFLSFTIKINSDVKLGKLVYYITLFICIGNMLYILNIIYNTYTNPFKKVNQLR